VEVGKGEGIREGGTEEEKVRPTRVKRWVGYGVRYPDEAGMYEQMVSWYTSTFTLKVSEEKSDLGTAFFQIDRGHEHMERSCFSVWPAKQGEEPGIANAVFEADDSDSVQLGHDFLASKGYEHRGDTNGHGLGWKMADYWVDCSGFVLGHVADGNMRNGETAVRKTEDAEKH
jgi:hypothetical protein